MAEYIREVEKIIDAYHKQNCRSAPLQPAE